MGAQNKVIAGDYEGCIVDGVFDEFYIVLGWNNNVISQEEFEEKKKQMLRI